MVINGKHILSHARKQAVGDTEHLDIAGIDNTLTKYTASKTVNRQYEEKPWVKDLEIGRTRGILLRPCHQTSFLPTCYPLYNFKQKSAVRQQPQFTKNVDKQKLIYSYCEADITLCYYMLYKHKAYA